jgi:hypothetical protein
MNHARYRHAGCVLTDGKVLVTGGYSGSYQLDSAEYYDPITDNWKITGNMHIQRELHTASLLKKWKSTSCGWGINDWLYRCS